MKHISQELFQALQQHQLKMKKLSLRRLFEEDDQRCQKLSIDVGPVYFDYSKNHINQETLALYNRLAEETKLQSAINSLLSGEHVNHTEKRAALHSALRSQGTPSSQEEQEVSQAIEKMAHIVEQLHTQQWLGFSGKPITTVVNIGIGGSDLGPRMVARALQPLNKGINVEFVANIDGADLSDVLARIEPETTLFIIASKSFSTLETLENAKSAKHWMIKNQCPETSLCQHFVAISTNISAAEAFGIAPENILPMWDWVGGRYSLWSTIGLPIAISIGMGAFKQLLSGANLMDRHFGEAPPNQNMPIIAAMLSFWYSQFWGSTSHAVLPYAQRLNFLPAFLQQLDMESLGKSTHRDGKLVSCDTGNIIWGTEGTNGQHSFHQLLHQGTHIIPVDFIMVKHSMSELDDQHRYLQACCISQSQALLKGKTLSDAEQELKEKGLDDTEIKSLAPHKVITGNKPSNTWVLNELSPENLGALIAFYEHKVYAQSVLLDINPFDQWGVELGKQLGTPIYQALQNDACHHLWDGSTRSLIQKLKS